MQRIIFDELGKNKRKKNHESSPESMGKGHQLRGEETGGGEAINATRKVKNEMKRVQSLPQKAGCYTVGLVVKEEKKGHEEGH